MENQRKVCLWGRNNCAGPFPQMGPAISGWYIEEICKIQHPMGRLSEWFIILLNATSAYSFTCIDMSNGTYPPPQYRASPNTTKPFLANPIGRSSHWHLIPAPRHLRPAPQPSNICKHAWMGRYISHAHVCVHETHTQIHTHAQTDRTIDRKTHKHTHTHTQIDRQADRQTDTGTNADADTDRHRQTDR